MANCMQTLVALLNNHILLSWKVRQLCFNSFLVSDCVTVYEVIFINTSNMF